MECRRAAILTNGAETAAAMRDGHDMQCICTSILLRISQQERVPAPEYAMYGTVDLEKMAEPCI